MTRNTHGNHFEPHAGENIYNAVSETSRMLKNGGWNYGFLTINDITLLVYPDSQMEDIATIYTLKHRLRQLGENFE